MRRILAACLCAFLFLACARKETVETYADGQRKLVREYSWAGARDSLHLRLETAYYFNGKAESETHFRNSRVNGMFRAYWENGQLKAEGRYAADEPEGEWNYYFNNFTPAAKGSFRNGLKEGSWIEYWENGELRLRGAYRQGNETGEWVGWNSAGAEILRTSCFESNPAGSFKSFYDNDSLNETYSCRKGKRIGPYLEKSPEGKLLRRGFYDSAGNRDSLWEEFHPNGRRSLVQHFRHGFQNDSLLAWDSLGRTAQKGFFRLGTGAWTRYDSLGRVTETKSFRDSLPLSLRRWHSNGKLEAEGAYADGRKNGLWKIWDPRGHLRESAEYSNGELHGERRFFDSTGTLMRVQKYYHGIPSVGYFPRLGNEK